MSIKIYLKQLFKEEFHIDYFWVVVMMLLSLVFILLKHYILSIIFLIIALIVFMFYDYKRKKEYGQLIAFERKENGLPSNTKLKKIKEIVKRG